ncbi:lipopolysaccharide biosynthesis protein [Glacieibacterium frigidum]|uniref:Oligosaccharide flippase family protein n=1 Tax=Glacieibacterium frigidum TaxID=2593303 RepID=A0A552U9V4_9SPHN|nr:oligosaccharide flippase family protein [Glacieibacterium frigidum]TRW14969.1 oligosaccharide flippase family protein [Glacieibacterium frigidum]
MSRAVSTADVARAAGTSSLARLGAVIEVLTTPALTWLFGVPAYGVYTVLAAAVTLCSGSIDLAMPSVLQRVVPQAKDEGQAHAAVKWALILGVLPSIAVATAVTVLAPWLGSQVNAAAADRATLTLAVTIFAWVLPLTSLVEVSTAAARARHAFGPEIRLRVFWEQLVRLGLAGILWLAWRGGWGGAALALAVAHLGSILVVAGLSLRLVARFYDWRTVIAAPLTGAQARAMLGYGVALIPANALRRALTDLPPILLNRWLPGVGGATAAGLYGIARKLSSIPQLVRTIFAYVMAPLASTQAAHDRAAIAPLYGFATRLATALALPLSALLVGLGDVLLRGFAPGATAAYPLVVVLVAARAAEAVAGPASAIIETVGNRARPTINAVVGVAVWTGLALLLVPRFGAAGMAAAVGAAVIVNAWLAVAELALLDGLAPFAAPFARTLAVAGAGSLSVVALGALPHGEWLVVPAALAVAWLALRFGLSTADRTALGGAGRRLRVAPDIR